MGCVLVACGIQLNEDDSRKPRIILYAMPIVQYVKYYGTITRRISHGEFSLIQSTIVAPFAQSNSISKVGDFPTGPLIPTKMNLD